MNREIFINVEGMETRVAIQEDGRLGEIHIERGSSDSVVGNIYKGIVTDVLPGMEAAFVDVGLEKNVFLHVSDVLALAPPSKKNPKIKSILNKGQEVVVQIVKEPIGGKGARATCELTIPGRYLVLMTTSEHVGISRRIGDEKERERLKNMVTNLKPPKSGVIVRTAAEGATEEQLKRDLRYLEHQRKKVMGGKRKNRAPCLLYKDMDLVQRVVRDTFTEDFNRLVVDDMEAYKGILQLVGVIAPHLRGKVELYQGAIPIFSRYTVEEDINKALQRKVWLKSGGYLVIDPTEALTSIDINTGKYVGKRNLEDTILKTNLEAAREIAHQLKLRDIGGIIIIDFIDMEKEEDRNKVLGVFQKEIEKDKTRAAIMGITKLGLVEMTRKKVKQGIGEYLQRECPYCQGTGHILTAESVALEAIHQLKKHMSREKFNAVLIEVHPEVASLIIGPGGKNLRRWEENLGKEIYVRGNESLHLEEINFAKTGSREELAGIAAPVKKGDRLNVIIQSQHTQNPEDGIARIEGFVIDVVGAGSRVEEEVAIKIEEVYRTFAMARIVDKD